MVLPGIQALFGFQLIAVFNQGFSEKLSVGEQQLHLVSIILVMIAVALVMAPAALHRELEPLSVSARFVRIASGLLLLSMLPLAISLSLDLYLIARVILNSKKWGLCFAAFLFTLFLILWLGLPLKERHRRRQPARARF